MVFWTVGKIQFSNLKLYWIYRLKSTDKILDITIIESSQSLKILIILFFLCSIYGPDDLSNMLRLSSCYKPKMFLSIILLNCLKFMIPAISQTSTPSLEPIGTSKSVFPDFFSQDWLLWRNRAFLMFDDNFITVRCFRSCASILDHFIGEV